MKELGIAAIPFIRNYNLWRRGEDETIAQPEPIAIGQALDSLCNYTEAFQVAAQELLAARRDRDAGGPPSLRVFNATRAIEALLPEF